MVQEFIPVADAEENLNETMKTPRACWERYSTASSIFKRAFKELGKSEATRRTEKVVGCIPRYELE